MLEETVAFETAAKMKRPPADTPPAREHTPTEAASSGDDDSPEAPPPPPDRHETGTRPARDRRVTGA